MSKYNRILLLSASAGAGHLRAAEALEKAVKLRRPQAVVQHADVLKYTNKIFRHLYSQAYLDLVNHAPQVLGWLYDRLDEPFKHERLRLAFERLNTGPFVRLLSKFRPELTISTHFLPSAIISVLKGKDQVQFSNNIVVTDFDVHAMWLCRNADRYFVALDETRAHLEALRVPPSRISVTGIPIDPVFAKQKNKVEMRLKHGLEANLFTVLVSTGGFGVGPVHNLVEALYGLSTPAQVVVICGRNEELRRELSEFARSRLQASCVHVLPIGYTTEMDELMTAADLFVGKPGGLTTSELLSKGVPLVIVNPIPGQEERNSDHLLEEGAAIRCNNLPVLAYKIETLLADRERLAKLRQNATRLGKPGASDAVLDVLGV